MEVPAGALFREVVSCPGTQRSANSVSVRAAECTRAEYTFRPVGRHREVDYRARGVSCHVIENKLAQARCTGPGRAEALLAPAGVWRPAVGRPR